MDMRLDDEIIQQLGARVEKLRLSCNLTQKQLADEAQVTVSTIYRLEQGISINLLNLVKILRPMSCVGDIDLIAKKIEFDPQDAFERGKKPTRVRAFSKRKK